MKEKKFFICERCGNLVEMINESGVPMMCCGQKMTKLEVGVVDASREKHLPEVEVSGNNVKVTVGSVLHPMEDKHSILWVYLLTDKGGYRKDLVVGAAPAAEFTLNGEQPLAVYAYCNLHGLWKKNL